MKIKKQKTDQGEYIYIFFDFTKKSSTLNLKITSPEDPSIYYQYSVKLIHSNINDTLRLECDKILKFFDNHFNECLQYCTYSDGRGSYIGVCFGIFQDYIFTLNVKEEEDQNNIGMIYNEYNDRWVLFF